MPLSGWRAYEEYGSPSLVRKGYTWPPNGSLSDLKAEVSAVQQTVPAESLMAFALAALIDEMNGIECNYRLEWNEQGRWTYGTDHIEDYLNATGQRVDFETTSAVIQSIYFAAGTTDPGFSNGKLRISALFALIYEGRALLRQLDPDWNFEDYPNGRPQRRPRT